MPGGGANVANRVFTFEDVDKAPEESLTVSIPEVLSAVSLSPQQSHLNDRTSVKQSESRVS